MHNRILFSSLRISGFVTINILDYLREIIKNIIFYVLTLEYIFFKFFLF